jgi:hypothetical protein
MLEKRAACPPSAARCVRRLFVFNELLEWKTDSVLLPSDALVIRIDLAQSLYTNTPLSYLEIREEILTLARQYIRP